METSAINPRYQEKIITIISNYLPACAIYLYGSRARQTHRTGSDIDLALDNNLPIDSTILANIRFDIEETTISLTINLVDVHTIDHDFLNTIKREWISWKQ